MLATPAFQAEGGNIIIRLCNPTLDQAMGWFIRQLYLNLENDSADRMK